MSSHNAVGQRHSRGGSSAEIQRGALEAAVPQPGLTWLDIGCGTGAVLRTIRSFHDPARLSGTDLIDWLDDDLRGDVELAVGPAEETLARLGQADRVLLIETIEHLEAPWSVLRMAARCVARGGQIVVTTPNIASFRHRIELLFRGRLTAFRPENLPHLTPALPHVIERVMEDEGLRVQRRSYVGRDVVPWTGGRLWPRGVHARLSRGTAVSVVIVADRDRD